MQQISGPSATAAHLGNYILGHLHGFGQMLGSANWPNIDQFGNFKTISSTKCKLKGSLFMPKNWVHIWESHFGQLAQFQKFSTISCIKSKLKGVSFMKKLLTQIWAISNKQGCLPIHPKWTNFEFFNNFYYKIKIQRGYIYGKNLTSYIFRADCLD